MDTAACCPAPRAFALIVAALALALAAVACENAATTPAPASESIAAALTAIPTVAPAPMPTAVPTATPAPMPTAVPTVAPAPMPTAVPTAPSALAAGWLPTALPTPAPPTPLATRPTWLPMPTPPTAAPMPTSAPATPTSAPAPTPTSTTADEARRVYEDAIDAMNALASYRLRTDWIIIAGDTKMSMDFRIQPPDLGNMKMTVGAGGQGAFESGYVYTDGYTYMKPSVNLFHADDPNRGKWIRRKDRGDAPPLNEFASGALSGVGANEVVGTERLDGVETLRLKGVVYSNSFGLGYAPMEARIWVGVADGLIRRVTAVTTPDADERIGVIMVFSDFDRPVASEAPKDYITLDIEQLSDGARYAHPEITPLDSGWTLAHLRDYGFSVSTPPDWFSSYSNTLSSEAVSAAFSLSAAMIQYVFPGQITDYEGDEMGVSVFNATIIGTLGDAALSEYVDDRMKHAKASLVIDGTIDRRTETLTAGEFERVEFAFRFRDKAFGDALFGMENAAADYAQIQYFILSEGDAYILTFATAADRIKAMRPIFDEIARTVCIEGRQ